MAITCNVSARVGLAFSTFLCLTTFLYAQDVQYADCQQEFAGLKVAEGGVLDPSQIPSSGSTVSVSTRLIFLDSKKLSGTIKVLAQKLGVRIALKESPGHIFTYDLSPGRYTFSVNLEAGGKVYSIAPPRMITIPFLDNQKAARFDTYVSETPFPFMRMGTSLVPIRPANKFIGVIFTMNTPNDAIAKVFADTVKTKYGIYAAKTDNTLEIGSINASGSAWLFSVPAPGDAAARATTIVQLRDALDHFGLSPHIGVPINVSKRNFSVLDNYFLATSFKQLKQTELVNWAKKVGVALLGPRTPGSKPSDDPTSGTWLVEFDEAENYCKMLASIEIQYAVLRNNGSPVPETVEPNLLQWIHFENPLAEPSDPDYWVGSGGGRQRASSHLRQNINAAWDLLNATIPGASELSKIGSSNVLVASLDTGVAIEDPEVACNASDGTPQLFMCYDAERGRPCSRRTPLPHGRAVFGVISACTNDKEIIGISPGTHQLAVAMMSFTPTTAYVDALRWAGGLEPGCWITNVAKDPCPPKPTPQKAQPKASVINCSHTFEWPTFVDLTGTYYQLANEGRGQRGTVVVYAAGNNGADICNPLRIAANQYVVGVANCKWSNNRIEPANDSNYGKSVDICAIGDGAITVRAWCDNASAPCFFGGTSAAAATISGVVALMLTANPDLCWWQVQEIVRLSITNYDDPTGLKKYGPGLIDARKAVEKAIAANKLSVQECRDSAPELTGCY